MPSIPLPFSMTDRRRFGLFYAALMVLPGAHLIYLGLWLQWRGMGAAEIAVVGAVPILFRIVIGPFVGFWADKTGQHARILRYLAAASSIASIAILFAQSFWLIVFWHIVVAVCWSSMLALGETVTMAAQRAGPGGQLVDYGRARLWGSVSFMVAGFVAGWLGTRFGPGLALVIAAIGNLATFAMIFVLPRHATADPEVRHRLTIRHATALCSTPAFVLFLLGAGLTNAAHATLYTFGTLHWQSIGYAPDVSSLFWLVSIVVEVALFALSKELLRFLSPLGLIAVGAGAGVLRWLTMGFDPPLAVLLWLQVLHAFTYAATHIGAMHMIARLVAPELAATAQTLYGTVALGVLMAIAVQSSGFVYARAGGGAYWLMAAISGLGLVAVLLLAQRVGWAGPSSPVLGRRGD